MAKPMDRPKRVSHMVFVGTIDDVQEESFKPIKVKGQSVLLIKRDGELFAIDNRCPHMGYPLHQGTMKNGLLRCHWHHWRFDVKSGGCFNGGGDDVPIYPVEVRGKEVWVGSEPQISFNRQKVDKAMEDLEQGIREQTTFLIAKAVTALQALHVDPREIVRVAALHGARYRQSGFGSGMTTLTCLTNILPHLEEEGQRLALVHGLIHVSRDTFNQPLRRFQRPLPTVEEQQFMQLKQWFGLFIEEREAEGAERCLLTAIQMGCSMEQVAEMVITAATDHFFLSTGHVLDFINKGFELVTYMGQELASEILPTLVPPLATAFRHEEAGDWSELVQPLQVLCASIPQLQQQGRGKKWEDEEHMLQLMLKGKPEQIIAAFSAAVSEGASVKSLSRSLVRAGIHRVARFHIQNEFDWDQVHHLLSYAHGLDRLVDWLGGRNEELDTALLKGVAHGMMYAYLTYFLNMPAARLPEERKEDISHLQTEQEMRERLLHCMEFQQVEEAGSIVHHYVQRKYPIPPLLATIGLGLLREDAGFHTIQNVEAAIQQYLSLGDHPDASLALVATTRYLTAQKLRRGILWSTKNAAKMQRGEMLDA